MRLAFLLEYVAENDLLDSVVFRSVGLSASRICMQPPLPPPAHFPPSPGQPPRPVFGQVPSTPIAPPTPAPAASEGHGDATELDDANFAKIVLDASQPLPILVECWADWCATCKLLLPTIQLLARELKGKAIVCTLNADVAPATSTMLQLQSMPTILVYKKGVMVNRLFGMQTKGKLLAALQAAGIAG